MSAIPLSEHERNSLEMIEEPDVTLISIKKEEDNNEYFDFQHDYNVQTIHEETKEDVLLHEVKHESDNQLIDRSVENQFMFVGIEKIINEDPLAADIKEEKEEQKYSLFEDYKYNIDIEENKLNCFESINSQSYTSKYEAVETSCSNGTSIFSELGEDKSVLSLSEDAVDNKYHGTVSSIKSHCSNNLNKIKVCNCCYCNITFCSESDLESHMKRVHMKEKKMYSIKEKKSEMFYQHKTLPGPTLLPKLDPLVRHQLPFHYSPPPAGLAGILLHIQPNNVGINVSGIEHGPIKTQNRCSSYETKEINTGNISQRKIRIYKCNDCCKMFSFSIDLQRHINKVHRKMLYFCEKCQKIFSEKQYLQGHISTVHKGIMLYECEKCHKMFSQKQSLQRHKNTVHSDVKVYECEKCQKVFFQKPNFRAHIHKVHGEVHKYECGECYKIFSQRACIQRHFRMMHKVYRNHM